MFITLGCSTLMIAALTVHQAAFVWERGLTSVSCSYAPVFSVRAPRSVTAFGQLAALPLALALAAVPLRLGPAPRLLALALVLLWTGTIQRRMANHAWLGTVATAALVLLPARLDPVLARDLLAGVYLSAALFKINREYLGAEHSAGIAVTRHYLRLLGYPAMPLRLLRPVPVAVILSEAALGVLLCVAPFSPWTLCLAVAMHAVFGLTGNFPFSIVALCLWACALSPAAVSGGVALHLTGLVLAACTAGSAVLAVCCGRSALGARTRSLLGRDAFLGAVYGIICVQALHASFGGHPASVPGYGMIVSAVVFLAFAANLLLVAFGFKLEWSFAMFSSLRPFGCAWLCPASLRRLPRYYQLSFPPTIPRALLRELDPKFLYYATRPGTGVYEAVAFHLEALAQAHNITFSPQLLAPASDGDRLIPQPADPDLLPRRRLLVFPAVIASDLMKPHFA